MFAIHFFVRFSICLLFFAAMANAAPGGKNLIPNGQFSDGQGKNPTAWKTNTWAGRGEYKYSEGGRNGGK